MSSPPAQKPDAPREIYLDSNASSIPLPSVVEAVARAMQSGFGNPSSVHSAGARARAALRDAREVVAAFVGASAADVVFTSGATEANNLVLQSLLQTPGSRLVTTAVEHSSILAAADYLGARGTEVVILDVDASGQVDAESVAAAVVPGRTLVSVQWANNETGVIQDLSDIARAAHEAGALFHTDAVQAVGKVPVKMSGAPIDLLSLSGHKIHGPLGVGALVGPGVHNLTPILHGGSQELGVRAGTENLPGIMGLKVALKERASRMDEVSTSTAAMRDAFENALMDQGVASAINGQEAPRLPNTTSLRFDSVDGEALTIRLNQRGVRCSQSSACTNHRPEPSYVLRAMGLTEDQAYASIRFGFSELNTMKDVNDAIASVTELHEHLTRFALA